MSGFAVCAYFAVRNPAHEIAARELIREKTGLPVTASHELSAKLGGPRRALTTLLNARLISMIDRLVAATEGFLEQRGIAAPLMVVRGDGALVSAAFARQRPIETILSGPAASLVGARHMTGLDEAVVSDIGGTTTDVAVLDKGRPRLDPEGATVGGFRTMVEAVAMRTFGLGGDSEVALEDGGLSPRILLGPRRVVPLALAAFSHGDVVIAELERQLRNPNPGRMDGRFAVPHRRAGAARGRAERRPKRSSTRRSPRCRSRSTGCSPRPRRTPRWPGWCRAGWCMSPASRRPMPPMCWASRPTGTRPRPGSAPSCSPASATAAASRSRRRPRRSPNACSRR